MGGSKDPMSMVCVGAVFGSASELLVKTTSLERRQHQRCMVYWYREDAELAYGEE